MRFENILHIYWTKGIFVCTKLHYFDSSISEIIKLTPGLGLKSTEVLRERFEFNHLSRDLKSSIGKQELKSKIPVKRVFNIMLSQVLSVNNNLSYLIRLRIIYQFLAKTYKGKCHAIGKPVYGQRT
jgi:ribosomal protein S13